MHDTATGVIHCSNFFCPSITWLFLYFNKVIPALQQWVDLTKIITGNKLCFRDHLRIPSERKESLGKYLVRLVSVVNPTVISAARHYVPYCHRKIILYHSTGDRIYYVKFSVLSNEMYEQFKVRAIPKKCPLKSIDFHTLLQWDFTCVALPNMLASLTTVLKQLFIPGMGRLE